MNNIQKFSGPIISINKPKIRNTTIPMIYILATGMR